MSDRDDAGAALVQLRRRVGDHFDAAVARTPEAFACRPGCSRCCGVRFGVFSVEADRIAAALRELAARDPAQRERVRAQGRDPQHGACALLIDDRCSIYDERPLICRSHGLPVRSAGRVEVCPLNFVAHEPPAPSVLALDALNAPLSVLARMWDPGAPRVELAELAAAP
ncbi:MAG: YkgJ family cysteine cluster protein [Nannocystaceae bacterium]|nr:YkgJ family cysteine cluster protein [Nannocystaceae bacterium]